MNVNDIYKLLLKEKYDPTENCYELLNKHCRIGSVDIVPKTLDEEQYKKYLQVELYYRCPGWKNIKNDYALIEAKYKFLMQKLWIMNDISFSVIDINGKTGSVKKCLDTYLRHNTDIIKQSFVSQDVRRIDNNNELLALVEASLRGKCVVLFWIESQNLLLIPNWLSINVYSSDISMCPNELIELTLAEGLYFVRNCD